LPHNSSNPFVISFCAFLFAFRSVLVDILFHFHLQLSYIG
jgi:hypothetical protein